MNVAIAVTFWILSWLLASKNAESEIKQSYPNFEIIETLRERFLLSLTGVNSDASALVAGLTIGERTLLSEQVTLQMKTLSLTHLVAVSGANLAIILGAVYFLSAALGAGRSLRFASALIVMVGYVLLVGPESSVIRAATMAVFVMVGLWLGRGSTPLNSLSLAIIFLLVVDPALATDIGFALSSFATAGLLLLAEPMFEYLRKRMPDFLALGIAASFSAQLFTTPVLLVLQPSLPLYSVLANLLVEPVVAPITILGIIGVVVASINIPLAGAFTYLASLMANWIVLVSHELSGWPMARLHFVQGGIGILLVGSIVVLVALSVGVMRRHAFQLRFASLLIFVVAASWSVQDQIRYQRFSNDFEFLACDVGQGDALILRSNGVVALVDVGPKPDKIEQCLDVAGIERIDLLVLTHFDSDHVAGISGALSGRSVGLALLPGFQDDRPLVKIVIEELAAAGVQIEVGRAGLSGVLGELNWKILQPTAQAEEAQDSNDASLVFAAWGEGHALLALGDLGESGQDRLMRNALPELDSLRARKLVLKVAHHGSADQSKELFNYLEPDLSIFSVGKNDYGHPASSALEMAASTGSVILRTDVLGPIAIRFEQEFVVLAGGKLGS